MRLYQGQVWQTPGEFIRIVRLDRLSVAYKTMADLALKTGTHHELTKKEFCRLLKARNAVLAGGAAPKE
ncbi:MAG: hypothetical protein HYY24_24990 [Verrucomicrobia bacterium]|nr:hypothetical protein [Verrucomicrobiota bacterium]